MHVSTCIDASGVVYFASKHLHSPGVPGPMQAPIVEVLSGSPESLRAQVDAAVIDTLDQGKSSLVVSLDALRAFDNSAINAIVRGLRTLRAVGGTMRLVTERDDHRKAL